MATSITPLSTLYDHPSVYRIPRAGDTPEPPRKKNQASVLTDEDPDLSAVEQARENVRTALEGRKYGSLNDLLIPGPEAPEYDRERAEKAKKLAKKSAIIQLIDSLAGIGEMAAYGDEAIVSPVDYSDLGLEALNQLADIDEQHRIDLRDFNEQRQSINRENQQIRQGVRQHNQNIDHELAEREENQALDDRQEHYEAALRYISQGKIELAQAHLAEAGLSPDRTVKKKTFAKVETPPETSLTPETGVPSTPSPGPDMSSDNRQVDTPEQPRVNSSNHAKMSTLENVLDAIEGSLAENPDKGTRQELLSRWKDATKEYLTLHEEVDDGSVGWWTEKLYDELLQGLDQGNSEEQAKASEENGHGTGEPKGLFGLINRMAKLITQPMYSRENVEDLEHLLDADPGHGMTWKQLRERRKANHDAFLKEYLPAQMAGDHEEASKHTETAEKQVLYRVQDSIGNTLASDRLDSETRFELTRRWINNNKRLLKLERPDLSEQERHNLSLEMFPQMLKEKQAEIVSHTPIQESIKPPTGTPPQPDRNRGNRGGLEIQDMKNSGEF